MPETDAIIIDGSAKVYHAIPPQTSEPFEDYARYDILPEIELCGTIYKRVDIVIDEYKKSSMEGETRVIRGHGVEND